MKIPDQKAIKDMKLSPEDGSIILHHVDENETQRMFHAPDLPTDSKGSKNYGKLEMKYIKYIENLIRSSYEYRQYIGILKSHMDLTKCRFIDAADINEAKVSLEMHHYPFTLFELVSFHKSYIETTEGQAAAWNPFKIAKNIMKMHFEGKIGLVPLSLTAHELVHEGYLFIPLNDEFVFGNWQECKSQLILNDDAKTRLEMLMKLTEGVKDRNDLDLDVLKHIQTTIIMDKEKAPHEIKNFVEEKNLA